MYRGMYASNTGLGITLQCHGSLVPRLLPGRKMGREPGRSDHVPCDILYSGKLLRKKTFANFAVLWRFAKVFSAKFGGMLPFGVAETSNSRKFFPSNVFRYTVLCVVCVILIIELLPTQSVLSVTSGTLVLLEFWMSL